MTDAEYAALRKRGDELQAESHRLPAKMRATKRLRIYDVAFTDLPLLAEGRAFRLPEESRIVRHQVDVEGRRVRFMVENDAFDPVGEAEVIPSGPWPLVREGADAPAAVVGGKGP